MSDDDAYAEFEDKEVTVTFRVPVDANGVMIKVVRALFGSAAGGMLALNDVKEAHDEQGREVAKKAGMAGNSMLAPMDDVLSIEG
jgi:hypothetical protein